MAEYNRANAGSQAGNQATFQQGDGAGTTGSIVLTFWAAQEEDNGGRSFKFTALGQAPVDIRYPITGELPHIMLPVGKKFTGFQVKGLLDTGGACTMGCLGYWGKVAQRYPEIVSHFEELEQHSEKPISIGGVGAGQVTQQAPRRGRLP